MYIHTNAHKRFLLCKFSQYICLHMYTPFLLPTHIQISIETPFNPLNPLPFFFDSTVLWRWGSQTRQEREDLPRPRLSECLHNPVKEGSNSSSRHTGIVYLERIGFVLCIHTGWESEKSCVYGTTSRGLWFSTDDSLVQKYQNVFREWEKRLIWMRESVLCSHACIEWERERTVCKIRPSQIS